MQLHLSHKYWNEPFIFAIMFRIIQICVLILTLQTSNFQICLFCKLFLTVPVLLLVDEGSAPLTAVQLLWVNMIMDTLGALALATEPPNNELMKRTPVGRKGNFISNVMWRNIMGQAIYQFLVIWYLQAEGKWLFGIEGDNSDLVLNTIIFNCFVFCQVIWKWFLHLFFCFYQICRPPLALLCVSCWNCGISVLMNLYQKIWDYSTESLLRKAET